MLQKVQLVLLIVLLSVGLLPWLAIVPDAAAAPCRAVGSQTVCIVEIKRSAKYPWEYRVTLSQDGVKQPQEIYNCRDRVRVNAAGITVPFREAGTGEWICRLVKQR
jgi:hypothetical protein